MGKPSPPNRPPRAGAGTSSRNPSAEYQEEPVEEEQWEQEDGEAEAEPPVEIEEDEVEAPVEIEEEEEWQGDWQGKEEAVPWKQRQQPRSSQPWKRGAEAAWEEEPSGKRNRAHKRRDGGAASTEWW